jgi:hypothetical protein
VKLSGGMKDVQKAFAEHDLVANVRLETYSRIDTCTSLLPSKSTVTSRILDIEMLNEHNGVG